MKALLVCVGVALAAAQPAAAEMRYDGNIEKAAMAIVAAKMGDLRGGFSYAQKPQLVTPEIRGGAAPAEIEFSNADKPEAPIDGLMPAVERRVVRIVF